MPSAFDLNPTIYIHTLGGFSIEAGGKVLNDSSNQSKKPWALLEYLAIFQKKDISPAELIQVIWPDDPGINPAGALKTLMFRSRKLLEPLDIPPQKLLVQQRGTYAWTKEYTTVLDIDEFETICTRVLNESLPEEEALSLCFAGVELYRGDFLPKAEYESWVIPISTYYHTLYQKLIHYTIHLLTAKKAFSQITALCQTAIAIEPFDEEFRYQLPLLPLNPLMRNSAISWFILCIGTATPIRRWKNTTTLWISFTVSFPSPPLIILRICIRSSVMTNRGST